MYFDTVARLTADVLLLYGLFHGIYNSCVFVICISLTYQPRYIKIISTQDNVYIVINMVYFTFYVATRIKQADDIFS